MTFVSGPQDTLPKADHMIHIGSLNIGNKWQQYRRYKYGAAIQYTHWRIWRIWRSTWLNMAEYDRATNRRFFLGSGYLQDIGLHRNIASVEFAGYMIA